MFWGRNNMGECEHERERVFGPGREPYENTTHSVGRVTSVIYSIITTPGEYIADKPRGNGPREGCANLPGVWIKPPCVLVSCHLRYIFQQTNSTSTERH